jgi:hypothetical protein
MLENLINLIKENAGESIINNPAVPNEHNEAVVAEAGNSIMSGLQGMLAQGNAGDVMSLFSNPGNINNNNPVVQQLSGGFLNSLMSKFGLSNGAASGIVQSLLPVVLNQLAHKTNNANDSSFNIQGIFNSLSGGNTSGIDIAGLLGKFTGNGGASNTAETAEANPLDALKGLFGQ